MAKAFALSVAYGANIGGIATLTGSPPNLVFKQQADKQVIYHTVSTAIHCNIVQSIKEMLRFSNVMV